MTDIGPVVQQGVISTQAARVHNDRPTAAEAPRAAQETSPPPPVESGRGLTVDTSA